MLTKILARMIIWGRHINENVLFGLSFVIGVLYSFRWVLDTTFAVAFPTWYVAIAVPMLVLSGLAGMLFKDNHRQKWAYLGVFIMFLNLTILAIVSFGFTSAVWLVALAWTIVAANGYLFRAFADRLDEIEE